MSNVSWCYVFVPQDDWMKACISSRPVHVDEAGETSFYMGFPSLEEAQDCIVKGRKHQAEQAVKPMVQSVMNAIMVDRSHGWPAEAMFKLRYVMHAWPHPESGKEIQTKYFPNKEELLSWHKENEAWTREFPDEPGDRVYYVVDCQTWDLGPDKFIQLSELE